MCFAKRARFNTEVISFLKAFCKCYEFIWKNKKTQDSLHVLTVQRHSLNSTVLRDLKLFSNNFLTESQKLKLIVAMPSIIYYSNYR